MSDWGKKKVKMASMKTVTTVHPAFRYESIVTKKPEQRFCILEIDWEDFREFTGETLPLSLEQFTRESRRCSRYGSSKRPPARLLAAVGKGSKNNIPLDEQDSVDSFLTSSSPTGGFR